MSRRGLKELGDIIAEIDSQIRQAGIRAHTAVLREVAGLDGMQIGGIRIPRQALIPRDLFETKRVAMEFDVLLQEKGASLESRRRTCRAGTVARLSMEWESVPAPEATALIRTRAELKLDHDLKSIPWSELDPTEPTKEGGDG